MTATLRCCQQRAASAKVSLPAAVCAMKPCCCIEGCMKPVDSHQMCAMHAQRVRRYGDPHYVTSEAQRRENNRVAQLARFDSVKPTTYRKRNGRHEHRVVAEQMLGRPLRRGEIVHHIDGNKHNNDPSNLQVMSQSDHIREHFNLDKVLLGTQGQSFTVRQLADQIGCTPANIYARLRAGWSIERIQSTPVRQWRRRGG
jgi:hypothetical protein